MRKFGSTALILGVLGYFYCSDRLSRYEAPPAQTGAFKAAETPAGRWQIAQYGCATLAAFGFLMALFPKGR